MRVLLLRDRQFAFIVTAVILLGLSSILHACLGKNTPVTMASSNETIALPDPVHESDISVEQALLERSSVRAYGDDPLTIAQISQLLWAAQGVTRPGGYRTAPSAGALYPLEVYLLAGEVIELPTGVYKYQPDAHTLVAIYEGDKREALWDAALNQDAVRDAPAVIVLAAVYERTTQKYGDRGMRYVHMEIGCAAQNVYLQAVSLGLGTVFIGAYYDEDIQQILDMAEDELPLGIMPVGSK